MRLVHLHQLDMNLLLALHVLIEERSVTRAAARLRLTASATSRALGRLRAHLNDALLVRTRDGMAPTPRALGLVDELRRALEALDALVAEHPTFDPLRVERTFRAATVDYAVAVLVPPLLARVARDAPTTDVTVRPLRGDPSGDLESGAVDIAVAPRRRAAAGVVWTRLFADGFVTVARAGHPRVGAGLSLDRFCELPHLVVDPEARPTLGAIDEALARLGRRRRVALRVPAFAVAPLVVADSDLIATLPARLARRFAAQFGLRVVPTPLALPALSLSMAWHERVRRDPGHTWFRRLVREIAATLP
jgi:DNA-binding transcriptional LysR family regulator